MSDLTFVISVVSQFMHASHTAHMDSFHHILKYLKTSPGPLGLSLFYFVGQWTTIRTLMLY
jgi:hypothetical protein